MDNVYRRKTNTRDITGKYLNTSPQSSGRRDKHRNARQRAKVTLFTYRQKDLLFMEFFTSAYLYCFPVN